MRTRTGLVLLAVAAGGAAARPATADVVFQDNFESYAGASGWFPAADWNFDYDPAPHAPPWVIAEQFDSRIQVVAHPQNLTGGSGYPAFAAAEGSQYLMFNQGSTYGENIAWAPVSNSPQQATVTVSLQGFGLSGHDGWHSGYRIVGYDSAATSGTNPAFDIRFQEGGYGSDGDVLYVNELGNVVDTGLNHNVNTWEDISIVADLATDSFSLTVDGVTVPGLMWAGDLSSIQSIAFMTADEIPNRRFGIDALTISTTVVPEPASLALLGLGAAAAVPLVGRGRRRR